LKKTNKKNNKKTVKPKVKTVKTTAKKKSKAAREASLDHLAKRTTKRDKPQKAPYQKKSYAEIGAEGEQEIYNLLTCIFGKDCVFRNVYVQRSSGRLTEIDLLAVHPTGVYVVESKNYSGLVCGDGNNSQWLHIKGSYKRSFYSPVAQNAGHVDALREACQYHIGFVPPMLSLLVFPDRCDLQIVNLPPGLRCCRLTQLGPVLGSVFQAVAPMLGQSHLQAIIPLFYQSQRSVLPESVQAQHMRDVAAVKKWASSK